MDERALVRFLAARGEAVPGHRPWPRYLLSRDGWMELRDRLPTVDWALLGLWADGAVVHAALRSEPDGALAVASVAAERGRFPSLSSVRPGARRLERAIQDLFGLSADGLDDPRPWLDHDTWKQRMPHARNPGQPLGMPQEYPFLPVQGEGLHQVPVGPVHAGIIEPGHFRFTCQGETVVRLEERLGYVHKGTERLMRGRLPDEVAKLAGRISGDSTVAHAFAFCLAVEAALDLEVPRRAQYLRALMAEMERLANHLNDIGAVCNDAAFGILQAECAVLREEVLATADACFGHRLMMDRVVPGGVSVDLKEEGRRRILDMAGETAAGLAQVMKVYEGTSSLQDRMVGTGIVRTDLAHAYAAGGYVGRASGRAFDARLGPGHAPYDSLDFQVPVLNEGDVGARVRIRAEEATQSIGLIRQILTKIEPGPARALLPSRDAKVEGVALVEGFRGDILFWVRLGESGRVERAHARDPSWFQWPLLEAAIADNIVADFPLCNKSFNCSYSGHDL